MKYKHLAIMIVMVGSRVQITHMGFVIKISLRCHYITTVFANNII